MPLFEVVLKAVYKGQQCINRWNYTASGTPAAVSFTYALASACGFIASGTPPVFPESTLFSGIRSITNGGIEYNEVIVNNIYTLSDFYTTAFPNNTLGLHSGEGASPFVAAGFRTNLVNRGVARGTKRFAGVPQTEILTEGDFTTTYVAALQVVANKMAENLVYTDEGNSLTFVPTICNKESYETPKGNRAYKYWQPLATQLEHIAQGFIWEPYDNTRSQTSRQVGKGK